MDRANEANLSPDLRAGPNLDHFDRLVVTPPVDKVVATFNLICQLKRYILGFKEVCYRIAYFKG